MDSPTDTTVTTSSESPKTTRRKFSDDYKLKILNEIDENSHQSGYVTQLMTREHIYSSTLSGWRKWRGKQQKRKQPKAKVTKHEEVTYHYPTTTNYQQENARLKKENDLLKKKMEYTRKLEEIELELSKLS